MKREIIGGIASIIIGGSAFAISQTEITQNFANETGMTQQEAEQYVKDAQKDLDSFANIGNSLITDAQDIESGISEIDCDSYEYDWETPALSCATGKSQLQTLATAERNLGNCYKSLDADLGDAASQKIRECIAYIDRVNTSYDQPMTQVMLESNSVSEIKKTNAYNKSLLQSALE